MHNPSGAAPIWLIQVGAAPRHSRYGDNIGGLRYGIDFGASIAGAARLASLIAVWRADTRFTDAPPGADSGEVDSPPDADIGGFADVVRRAMWRMTALHADAAGIIGIRLAKKSP